MSSQAIVEIAWNGETWSYRFEGWRRGCGVLKLPKDATPDRVVAKLLKVHDWPFDLEVRVVENSCPHGVEHCPGPDGDRDSFVLCERCEESR